jgi:hypothetical protein
MLQASLSNMHSVSHSLVHRGPTVSATRACRWQPYSSTASTSTQSHQNWTPNTPASSLAGSPSTSNLPRFTNPAPPSALKESSGSHPPLGRTASVRDVQKSRYITALVGQSHFHSPLAHTLAELFVADQAVKSLGEIWRPEDIPADFTSTSAPRTPIPTQTTSMPNMDFGSFATAGSSSGARPSFYHHNTQLPSPVTPSTQPSPAPPRAPQSQAATPADFLPPTTVPLRSFVLEVLKRSKTSTGVLQTALCYIAAIAHKVPVLAAQEQMGLAGRGEPRMEDFITSGLDEGTDGLQGDLARDDASTDVNAEPRCRPGHSHTELPVRSDAMDEDADVCSKTVRVDDDLELLATPDSPFIDSVPNRMRSVQPCPVPQRRIPGRPPGPSPPLPPLPPLPNPLLCPRRTFLAAVILASKFTQDKCFSNKAWARLAGLPAREISRCERALGAALEWRLWVGKLPSVPAAAPGVAANASTGPRTLSRTKTVVDMTPSTPAPSNLDRGCLGRSRTLPAHSFGEAASDRNAAPCSQQWPAGGREQDAAQPGISTPANSGEGYLYRHCLPGMPMHASPSSMSTPALSYSPATTSSSNPTPMIRMADGDGRARSPAVDGPWGFGGAIGGVPAAAFSVPGTLGAGAHLSLDKLRVLHGTDSGSCAYVSAA